MQQIIIENISSGFEIKKSHMIKKYMGKIIKPWTWLKWEKSKMLDSVELKEMSIVNKL